MREAQKIERLGFSLSSLFPILLGKAPELDPARFVWVKFQTKLLQSLPEVLQEAVCVCLILETQDRVSSPGEFPPEALSELYMNLSAHTAPTMEPRRTPICQ